MFASLDLKKLLMFGLLGAVGCLIGWGVGEGFLAVAVPKKSKGESASPSIASKPQQPTAPKSSSAAAVAPPPTVQAQTVAPPLAPEFRARLERFGGQSGDVQISLFWESTTDLDLHCVDPGGEEIYFRHKTSLSGGELDVDKNAGCSGAIRDPAENIRWLNGRAPRGTYRVYVKHYSQCADPDLTDYKVSVKHGTQRREFSGSIRNSDPKRLIYEFAYGEELQFAVSPKVQVYAGDKNRIPAQIVRGGITGPIKIRAAEASAGLTIAPAEIAAGGDKTDLEIVADAGVQVGSRTLKFVAEAPGVASIEATTVVEVLAPARSLQLAAAPEIRLHAGTKRNELPVAITRAGFSGPVTVRLVGEIDGVESDEVAIPAGESEATLELNAEAEAESDSKKLRVEAVAAADGSLKAEAPVEIEIVAPPPKKIDWLMILIIGLWTALLAVGLSSALVVGQNRYMSRPLLNGREALILLAGGVAAGVIGGGIGQTAYAFLDLAKMMGELGFLLGWIILGGLVGRGLGFFVPNLKPSMAVLAGAVGGLLGAGAFLGVSALGDIAGRAAGAAILGACIGLVTALIEAAFRDAWLEIAYGPRETRTVNLGPEPVKIGSNSSACAVWTPGVDPVVVRFWIAAGKVMREQVPTKQQGEVSAGHRERVGGLEIVVRKGTSATAGAPQPTRAPPPPPPRPSTTIPPAQPPSAGPPGVAAKPQPPTQPAATVYTATPAPLQTSPAAPREPSKTRLPPPPPPPPRPKS